MSLFKKRVSQSELGQLLAYENHAYLGDVSIGAFQFAQSIDQGIVDDIQKQTMVEVLSMIMIGELINYCIGGLDNSSVMDSYYEISKEKMKGVSSKRGVVFSDNDFNQHISPIRKMVQGNTILKNTGEFYSSSSGMAETIMGQFASYIIDNVYLHLNFSAEFFVGSSDITRLILGLNTQMGFSRKLYQSVKVK